MHPSRFLAAVLPLMVIACGTDGSGQGGSAGSGAENAGGTPSGAGTGGGGTSSGAGTGGGAGTAMNAKPMGLVQTCFGPKCPIQECDNDKFWADVACSDVYPDPVGEQTSYCAPDGTGNYCLEIIVPVNTGGGDLFAINCAAGVADIVKCDSSCAGNEPATCVER